MMTLQAMLVQTFYVCVKHYLCLYRISGYGTVGLEFIYCHHLLYEMLLFQIKVQQKLQTFRPEATWHFTEFLRA